MGLLEAHRAMAGKTAVVVGGAAGHLGRGTTLGLAGEGVSIICCDNDREGLTAIVPEVEALGVTIDASYADVTDPASLDAFYDRVETLTGGIDILVNVPGSVARARTTAPGIATASATAVPRARRASAGPIAWSPRCSITTASPACG